jgi:cytochrome oxidase assembly protein ShyY1
VAPVDRGARFLLRPRWILSHLFVVGLIVAFVNLGLWQLRRLDERRERNDVIAERLDQAAVPIDAVEDLGAARFMRVTVRGEYAGDEIRVLNRSLEGSAGEWLIGAIDLGGGGRVLVGRGFLGGGEPAPPVPDGEVVVEGYVIPAERLDRTAKVDLEDPLAEPGTLPVLVQRISSQPAEPGELDEVPPPSLDEGPHLSYAFQWFVFATLSCIAYPLALRRIVRRRGKEASDLDELDDLDRELAVLVGQDRDHDDRG